MKNKDMCQCCGKYIGIVRYDIFEKILCKACYNDEIEYYKDEDPWDTNYSKEEQEEMWDNIDC